MNSIRKPRTGRGRWSGNTNLNMFIKWLKSSEKCEHLARFRKLRKITIFWEFLKISLFKLNFKIEVLAKWIIADFELFRMHLI